MSSLDRQSWSLNNPDFGGWDFAEHVAKRSQYVWDANSLAWVKMTQPGGGTGGGAVTVADGADVAEGATTDAATTGAGTVSAKLRNINTNIAATVGLGLPIFDYAAQSQSTTQDVWTFKTGGSGGTLVATVTINYTDSTKAVITNVAKT